MPSESAERALGQAVTFLLSAQDGDGWWRDFEVAGPSDAWVSAVVASALAENGQLDAVAAARRAWEALKRRQRWGAGWGYAAHVPRDADTTSWALRVAETVGTARTLRARRGYGFLARHLRPDGGIATFAAPRLIQGFTAIKGRFGGWCGSHTCVTAVAAQLDNFPHRQALLQHLRRQQLPDGAWAGYWWDDAEYATAMACLALHRAGHREDRSRMSRAADWAMRQSGPRHPSTPANDSPFAIALRLQIMALVAPERRVAASMGEGVDWLLRHQQRNGSWSPSARLRVPPPHVTDPSSLKQWGVGGTGEGSVGNIVSDQYGIFTTATAVGALSLAIPCLR